jgi:hypothetical protein
MSRLSAAVAQHHQGLAELQRSRAASDGWSDEQRHRLDRQCLQPLEQDGRRLLDALRRAAAEIAAAEAMLS